MLACSSLQSTRAEPAREAAFSVLEVSPSVYDPTGVAGDGPALQGQCARWSLTREQAETFIRLSKPIGGEKQHSTFYALPCHIDGRAQGDNRIWQLRINAAATATLTSNGETRVLGCSDPACEPLVLMMPEGSGQ